jgi:RND family efflux transporter MFP subunit
MKTVSQNVWPMLLGAGIVLSLSGFVGAQPVASAKPLALNEGAITSFGGVKAPTRASRDATLSYTFPVEIASVIVKGGQHVKKGDPLVQGRDDEYRLQRDLQKTIAESDLDIQHAQAEVDQAEVEFKAQETLRDKKTSGTPIEFERAKTVLTVKRVELALAKLQSVQQKLKLGVNQAQLDRLTLKAPFDGIIDNVLVEVGEVKKEAEPILKIVATDPMWMDVNAPTSLTMTLGLKPGDKAWILLDVPGEPAVYVGKVIEIGAESDFAGQTRRVRVELANPSEWPVGPAAWVRFAAPEGEWAKRIAEPKRTAEATGAAK